jgi:PAS domain-containing protein
MDRMSDALGPLVTPRSPRRTYTVLAVAAVLMVGVLVARLANSDPANGILALDVIPITIVALELGLLPAVVYAVAALASVVVWDLNQDVHIQALEYMARAAVYFPIAIAAGVMAGRLRTALDAVETSEGRLSTVVESSTDALISSDGDGRITAWNPAAQEVYGWRAD